MKAIQQISILMPFFFLSVAFGQDYTPSDIISIAATPAAVGINIKWTNASESGLNYYELQRSADGRNFETIAMIFKKEAESDDYNYPDRKPPGNINYYRLKIVNTSYRVSYSSITLARQNDKSSYNISISPNPVKSFINIQMSGLPQGNYRVDLTSIKGQVYLTKMITVNQNQQTETISRENVPSGICVANIYDKTHDRVISLTIIVE